MFITTQDVEKYNSDGFVVVENVFSEAEVQRMITAVKNGERVASNTRGQYKDEMGRSAKVAVWHELGDDIWSAISTSPRIVNGARILLGEEISFFHGKVIFKEARSGGAWVWHQDYGYWYDQGFVNPNIISAYVALDEATIENGCIQMLKATHKLGRINHETIGETDPTKTAQFGANLDRVHQTEKLFEKVYCQMKPGSVMYFHSNVLHMSANNDSDRDRRAFIVCYSALDNPQIAPEKYIKQDFEGNDEVEIINGNMVKRKVCPVSADDAILTFK